MAPTSVNRAAILVNLTRQMQLAIVGHYIRKRDKMSRSRLLLVRVGQLKLLHAHDLLQIISALGVRVVLSDACITLQVLQSAVPSYERMMSPSTKSSVGILYELIAVAIGGQRHLMLCTTTLQLRTLNALKAPTSRTTSQSPDSKAQTAASVRFWQ